MFLQTKLGALSALTCLFASIVALAGHDNIEVDPAFKRYAGLVTALGSPDPEGRIYSFQAVQGGPARAKYVPDELRGWRLTVLAGKRFAAVFEVQANTESEIPVMSLDGPLNGLAGREWFWVVNTAGPRGNSG